MIQIITDSASDITLEQAERMHVQIVPLAITFKDCVCPQERDEDFDQFYQKLIRAKELPTTSQPTPEEYLKIFKLAKEKGDEVLVIALSSGLSGTVQSARLARDLIEYDKIAVVDSRQAILTQRMLVEYAVRLRAEGKSLKELEEGVKELRDRLTVCGMLDTLTYLKKGGRVPASLAVLGNVLRIKPVIVLKNKVLEQLGKARGRKEGLKMLYMEMKKARFDPTFPVYFGYTLNEQPAREFQRAMEAEFDLKNTGLYPVGGVIGTHVGPNCVAVAFAAEPAESDAG